VVAAQMKPEDEQRSEPIRSRIVAATLSLIAEEGLDAVRHRRVAELAGVSLGSTSYHFASRDDLIEAAFELYLDEATVFLDELTPQTPLRRGDADAVVELLVQMVEREFQDPLSVLAEYELILYAARHESIAARFRAWEAAQHLALAELLDAVGIGRPQDAASTLVALVRGTELERVASPSVLVDVRRRVGDVLAGLSSVST
jgi:DNA-binding transcriptional regulator YbjK